MAGDKLTDLSSKTTSPDASAALAHQALSAPPDTSTIGKISSIAHTIGAKTTDIADGAERVGLVTGKAIFSKDLAAGIWHASVYDIEHPVETAAMIAESATFGAVLKTVMSEKSPVGKVGGLAVGAYFLYEAAKPMGEAYGHAIDAKTDKQLDASAKELGEAAGTFGVNSAIGMAGFKVGAGAAGRVLEGESFDKFAVAKEAGWDAVDGKATSILSKVRNLGRTVPAESLTETVASRASEFEPRVRMDGERAHLLDTKKAAPDANVTGDINPDSKVSITLMAKTKGSPLLMDRYINRIARRGAAPLTDAQITEKFGTDAASGKEIEKFAADHGLKITDTNHASGRYFVEGTAQNMEKAFGVKWQEYEKDGVTFRGREGTLSVAPEVAPHIKFVLGLDNRRQYHTNYVKLSDYEAANASPAAGAVESAQPLSPMDVLAKHRPQTAVGDVPADAATTPSAVVPDASGLKPRAMTVAENFKAYNAPAELTGKGMTTGFVSYGGTMPEGWLDYLVSKKIDPKLFSEIDMNDTPPVSDPKGANGENALDGGIHKEGLPEANTVMIKAPNDDSGAPNSIDRATFPKPGELQITHLSDSWGLYEDGTTVQSRAAMTDAGNRAALKNITVTAAAGDDGAGDRSPTRRQSVDSPAGLAAFTALGGTQLIVNSDGTYASEKTWSGMGATGGGQSIFEKRPKWQDFLSKIIPANLNGSKFIGRAVPDIAYNADPRSGWMTHTDDGVVPIGGTSAASPAAAIAAAKISEATGKLTGFWNPQLYDFGKNNPGVFNDVTVGNNDDNGVKGYPATKGYDLNTGWGSVNIGKMIQGYNDLANQHGVAKAVTIGKDVVSQRGGTQVPAWLVPSAQLSQQHLDEMKKAAGQ